MLTHPRHSASEPGSGPTLLELDQNQSGQVLTLACAARSEVVVCCEQPALQINARCIGLTERSIELSAGTTPPEVNGAPCSVQLAPRHDRFLFESCVTGIEPVHGGSMLRLHRPENLFVSQRRRFWRAATVESSTARLADRARSFRIDAAVLNVSPDGFACRVERSDVRRLSVGDRLDAGLSLAGGGTPIDAVVTVRAITQGGDPGRFVVGVQFNPSTLATQERDRLIRHTRPAMEPA